MLPQTWDATLLAIDGATMSSVERQLPRIPDGVTHLILSVGGNDLLQHSAFILTEPTDSYANALVGMAKIRDDFSREYGQVLSDVRTVGLPLAVCTIYDCVPGLRPPESAGLSMFNDVITKHVISCGATLIDLRVICSEQTDFAPVSPIEPSAAGGGKIAGAIHRAIFCPEDARRVVI